MRLTEAALSAWLVGALAGCAPAARPASLASQVTQAEWTRARARLASARAEIPRRPYAERVRVAMTEPRTGRQLVARGALAVRPGAAARMLLLGPGGTTAVDLWVTPDRFRVAVPAANLVRRGGTDAGEARGLPVGMLRWWFLAPLSGRLLAARAAERESSFWLRDREATVMVRTDGARFVALRTEAGRSESLEWRGARAAGTVGHAVYVDGQRGLRVEVLVEEVMGEEPDPAAFDEPGEDGSPAGGEGS